MKAPLLPKKSRRAKSVFKKMTKGRDEDPSDNSLTPESLFEPINGSPTDLTLTPQEDAIDLAWTNGSTNETGIIIERGLDAESFAGVNVVSNGEAEYTDDTTEQETDYYYRVRAFKGNSYSEYSEVQLGANLNPIRIFNFVISAGSDTEIVLNWDAPIISEDGVIIERSLNGTSYSVIHTTNGTVQTYTNTGLTTNTLYYYRIRSIIDEDYSNYSEIKSRYADAGFPYILPIILN